MSAARGDERDDCATPWGPDPERAAPLVVSTANGLYCPPGEFYIDPQRPVERAVITHAHADHLRRGCDRYLTTTSGGELLRARLKRGARIELVEYRAGVTIRDVRVSLHPAGHILGSAQVRIEHGGQVWVVSGDYKRRPDPTCEAFEPVCCDVFITEATFATPQFVWPAPDVVVREIDAWRRMNARAGRTSVLLAYALGKAQRLIASLDATIGPLVVHPEIAAFNELYRAAGVILPRTHLFDPALIRANRGAATVIVPPRFGGARKVRRLGEIALGRASGWSQAVSHPAGNGEGQVQEFAFSDHADFSEILGTVAETGAARVGVMHGYAGVLIAALKERGLCAWHLPTRYRDEYISEPSARAPGGPELRGDDDGAAETTD